MLFSLTQRLPSVILRTSAFSHATFSLKPTIAPYFHSRSFVTTPLAKSNDFGGPVQPPEMAKDDTWDSLDIYSKKNTTPQRSPEQIWHDRSAGHPAMPIPSVYAGRSIPVIGGNVSKAMSGLALRLKLNNVAGTWRYQMRHEKKGVKRRRLSSERWRRRFSDEIRRKIELVRSIQRRGQ